MNITKDIINDLLPLYAANECSADTRALVEDYFRQHPDVAAEFRRAMNAPVPRLAPSSAQLDEMAVLRQARQRVRGRSLLMGFAIFFSLAPFSFISTDGHTRWLFLESPKSAVVYAIVGVICWAIVLVQRRSSRDL